MQPLFTVVLLPGTLCDSRLWSSEVRAAFGSVAVVDADLTADNTIAGMASRALAVPGRLLPVGFSLGGIVALEMARQAPERIAAMVLADTNARSDLPERAAVKPRQQAQARAGQLAAIVADELKPAYLAAANRDDAALKALLFDMAMGLGSEVFCRQSEALRTRADNTVVLDSFTRPVLLLAGVEDTLCPPAWHEAMALRLAHPTLRIIDGAGHMLPLERPRDFAVGIAAWLTSNPELV